jgi:hypothetical protein
MQKKEMKALNSNINLSQETKNPFRLTSIESLKTGHHLERQESSEDRLVDTDRAQKRESTKGKQGPGLMSFLSSAVGGNSGQTS